jgi:hypothetical protein
MYDKLENDFGRVFVRAALGFVTFSVSGVNDLEMQDLLSVDDAVCDAIFQYSRPHHDRVPLHVWLRLRFALDGLVVEREHGKLTWYHRQLRETAESRYSEEEKLNLHRSMALYFGNLVDHTVRQRRFITLQPISLNGRSPWFPGSIVNRTRCIEASVHMLRSDMLHHVLNEICDLETICAIIKAGEGFNLIKWLIELRQRSAAVAKTGDLSEGICVLSAESTARVDHYCRWLLQDMNVIAPSPSTQLIATCSSNQPLISLARQDVIRLLNCLSMVSRGSGQGSHCWSRDCWAVPRSLGGETDKFGPLLMTLPGV